MMTFLDPSDMNALIGGVLIGLSAAIFILFNGRIAGISGIISGLLNPQKNQISWRLCFLLGLAIAPVIYRLFSPLPHVEIHANTLTLVAAGLLVGVGTRLASGCTSGHGVCGIARLSWRSVIATLIFICTGMVTVFLLQNF